MPKYLVSDRAKQDIGDVVRFIRRQNPDASIRVRQALRAGIKRIGDMPGVGHVRDELGDDSIRARLVYSYLIVYRWEARPVEVLRVTHGSRNLRAEFYR